MGLGCELWKEEAGNLDLKEKENGLNFWVLRIEGAETWALESEGGEGWGSRL